MLLLTLGRGWQERGPVRTFSRLLWFRLSPDVHVEFEAFNRRHFAGYLHSLTPAVTFADLRKVCCKNTQCRACMHIRMGRHREEDSSLEKLRNLLVHPGPSDVKLDLCEPVFLWKNKNEA